MIPTLSRAWTNLVQPILSRPRRIQVAALCLRDGEAGKEVLLITSRETRRWVLPKGWPMAGTDGPGSAAQEAWEEAGARCRIKGRAPVGSYTYGKRLRGGLVIPVETLVYPMQVEDLERDYPEVGQRERRWVPVAEAAELVNEPGLKALLLDLTGDTDGTAA